MEEAVKKNFNEAHARANQSAVDARRHIVIDPITRLEGHGKIDIVLNKEGSVDKAYFQIPELRGFEVFSQGRPAEDMPQITSRICGVCPMAHHMAATKALDNLYQVEPTQTAKNIRELVYDAFTFEDHALHVYILGGPDFIVGPDAPKSERNILGVIGKVGIEVGKQVIDIRKRTRDMVQDIAGKIIHPVHGLPGGVSKRIPQDKIEDYKKLADDMVEFGKFTLQVFKDIVLANQEYVDLITSPIYTHETYYMGMVDKNNCVNFYDGDIRVVDPNRKEFLKFKEWEYQDHVAEHVEPWSYVKFCYLKKIGWKGFVGGKNSGIYAVAPLARLNVSDKMATPEAQIAFEEYFETLGGKDRIVHHTLANHWARVIEMIYVAERVRELINDPITASDDIRNIPTQTPKVGRGIVEAPRGTLYHHFETDPEGILTKVDLVVATTNNAARMAMSVDQAAKGLIKNGVADDGLLNKIEMAFRAYDPCHGCATHSLPGQMPLAVQIRNHKGEIQEIIKR